MTTAAANPSTATIEVFRSGTFGPMQGGSLTFTAADLAASASAYDPDRSPAPVVIGHPTTDAPAFGWVAGLRYEESRDRMVADVTDLEPTFAEAVRARRWRRVSMSFFRPDSAANPVPGIWYPKHLGFLGAAPPAVTGLAPVQFAGGPDDVATVDFAFPADEVPPMPVPTPTPTPSDPAEFAAREAQLNARATALAARERQITHDANVAFAAQLVSDGRVLPVQRDALVAMLDSVEGGTAEVAFAAGDAAVTPAAALRRLLSGLPVKVPFGEIKDPPPGREQAAAFAAPDNRDVDQDRLALHAKALAYQRQHPDVDYLAAVRAVEQEG